MIETGREFHRGELYYANLNPIRGSEQGGIRPVLILQNDRGNRYCPTLIVAPVTRQSKRMWMPTHCSLEQVDGLAAASMVMLEQIKTIDKSRVVSYIGKISLRQMQGVEEAMRVSLGMRGPDEKKDSPEGL